MNVKYTHLKRKPGYIVHNPLTTIDDYSIVCTATHERRVPFKAFHTGTFNDPTVLCGFEKTVPENIINNSTIVEQILTQSKISFMGRPLFFGFPNITSFWYYIILLYVIYQEHEDSSIQEMAESELERISSVFFVSVIKNGVRVVYTLKESLVDKRVLICDRAYETLRRLIRDKDHFIINTVASYENKYFSEELEAMNGTGHVYLAFHGSEVTFEGTSFSGLDVRIPNYSCPIYNIISKVRNTPQTLIPRSKNLSLSLLDPQEVSSRNYHIKRLISRSHEFGNVDTTKIPVVVFEALCISKDSSDVLSLDTIQSELKNLYSDRLRNIMQGTDMTAQYVGNIEEYLQYRGEISKLCKSLDIKAVFVSDVVDDAPYTFKLKVDYQPKNTSSLVKLLTWIGEIDPSAVVSNVSFKNNASYSYTHNDTHDNRMYRELVLRQLNETRTNDMYESVEHKNLKVFIGEYFAGNKMDYHNFKTTKAIGLVNSGILKPNNELLTRLLEHRFGGRSLTISVRCVDIKSLNKIKLMSASIREVSFHMKDRKDVLEYFNNY